jgi:hypothetical protein
VSIRGFTSKSNFIFFVGIVGKCWEILGNVGNFNHLRRNHHNHLQPSSLEPGTHESSFASFPGASERLRHAPAKQAAPIIRSDASGIALTWRPTRISSHRSPRHIGATQNPTSRCQASFDYVKDHRRTRITHRPSLSNSLLTIYII